MLLRHGCRIVADVRDGLWSLDLGDPLQPAWQHPAHFTFAGSALSRAERSRPVPGRQELPG